MSGRQFLWLAGGRALTVHLEGRSQELTARVDGLQHTFRIVSEGPRNGIIEIDHRRYLYYWTRQQAKFMLWLNGAYYELVQGRPDALSVPQPSETVYELRANMPGTIVQVPVRAGEHVARNQPLVIMESMKMETILRAPDEGLVRQIHCTPGEVVEMGRVLMILEKEP